MRHPSRRIPHCSESTAPWPAVLAALFLLLLPGGAAAHAMLHEVVDGEAVTLKLSYGGAEQPLFEPYEVFAPGLETPFQSGRVNALGELSFRPDRPGTWRVRVATEDGHGAMIRLEVDEAGVAAALPAQHGHAHDYWPRVVAALGYLLGVFGLLALWRARRARRARTGPG
jgi:nickel transport protein